MLVPRPEQEVLHTHVTAQELVYLIMLVTIHAYMQVTSLEIIHEYSQGIS